MRELVNSHIKLKRQVGAVARRETQTFGFGHGPDFPGNDGSYPALPQPEINEYRCWIHTERCRTYHYFKDHKLWLSDTELSTQFNPFGVTVIHPDQKIFVTKFVVVTNNIDDVINLVDSDGSNQAVLETINFDGQSYISLDIDKELQYNKFLIITGDNSITSSIAYYRLVG